MSESSGDNPKYKWTHDSTALLVSVWSDQQVQKQLEYTSRPLMIWEKIAHYMRKKGYNVTAKQCRSRMKQVLVCYREAKRADTSANIEQYYETVDRVLKKRIEHINTNTGIDTVDSTANYVKAPVKDLKTNKNLQVRMKVQEPKQSLFRTEALSPTWTVGHEHDYPDSPESNETIIAKPYRVLSPTRDVAINTNEHMIQIGNRAVQTNLHVMEEPVQDKDVLISYPYGEIPYQNAVQNVQNQIIQENMQQYQSNLQQSNHIACNQLPQQQNMPTSNQFAFQQNMHTLNQHLPKGMTRISNVVQNPNMANFMRQQNQLQQGVPYVNNQAMPQEPRKVALGQNMMYKQCGDIIVPHLSCMADINKQNDSPDYSPDVSQNFNDAFCQPKSNEMKAHNLNETYSHSVGLNNAMPMFHTDATVLTNNATCNDNSMLLEFLSESPIPSENDKKLLDNSNTDEVPNAPFRKKKAQKELEQLMLNAINSQNEVVNKILAAQNAMVTQFLDVDRDRQNRLENRLDHLLNVVHATVLNKNESSPSPSPPLPLLQPKISTLLPPPKPGMVPPKLDLVPPKPCRVPCTVPNSNIELINQNPVLTRPGVVSPITSPTGRKLGTIWSKLGPVSTSPFVKAQQRFGFQPIPNNDFRTQSSAERRIAKEVDIFHMNTRNLIYETTKLLEMERENEEKIGNARLEAYMSQILTARNKLFTQREPTPIMILTAAFLDAECRACEKDPPYYGSWNSRKQVLNCVQQDKLLTGQGESYERMRHLNLAKQHGYLDCEPCDTSTPAKFPLNNPAINEGNINEATGIPKQTIQQLAQLVMNSARWREAALSNQQHVIHPAIVTTQPVIQDVELNVTFTAPKANAPPEKPQRLMALQKQDNYNKTAFDKPFQKNPQHQTEFPMGFTTTVLAADQKGTTLPRQVNKAVKSLGFVEDPLINRKNNVRFMDDALIELQRIYIENQKATAMTSSDGVISAQNRNMIEQYANELAVKKAVKDKDTDSENDDEYLDTTASGIHPPCIVRKGSLTSSGTTSTEAHSVKSSKANPCIIS